jgi:HNH endonuclease
MKTHDNIDSGFLRSILSYDPVTGIFRWIASPNHRAGKINPGDEAGYIGSTKPYRYITIDGAAYSAHRLAWLYMTGSFPPHQVDHKDLNKTNNAWDNLRRATGNQNQANKPKTKQNTSGLKGVNFLRGKWRAQITHNGKTMHIGVYDTLEDGHEAYCREAKRLHGEFWHKG